MAHRQRAPVLSKYGVRSEIVLSTENIVGWKVFSLRGVVLDKKRRTVLPGGMFVGKNVIGAGDWIKGCPKRQHLLLALEMSDGGTTKDP